MDPNNASYKFIIYTFSTGRFGRNPAGGGFGLGPGLPFDAFEFACSNGAFTDNFLRVMGLAGANGGGAMGGGGRKGGGGDRIVTREAPLFVVLSPFVAITR